RLVKATLLTSSSPTHRPKVLAGRRAVLPHSSESPGQRPRLESREAIENGTAPCRHQKVTSARASSRAYAHLASPHRILSCSSTIRASGLGATSVYEVRTHSRISCQRSRRSVGGTKTSIQPRRARP